MLVWPFGEAVLKANLSSARIESSNSVLSSGTDFLYIAETFRTAWGQKMLYI